MAPKTTITIKPRQGFLDIDWRSLWSRREVALALAARDLRVRYKQTLLGGAWAILQPLATMAVLSVVFGRYVGIDSKGVPYPIFAYAGLLPWLYMTTLVSGATRSVIENAPLVTKVHFPRVYIPLSVTGYATLDLILSTTLLVPMMIHYGMAPGPRLWLLPVAIAGVLCCGLGSGLLFAALAAKYRDARHLVPFLLQLWLFASPVLYPLSVLPEPARSLAALNPMYGLIGAFRASLLGTMVGTIELMTGLAVASAMLLGGLWYFTQAEDGFADVL